LLADRATALPLAEVMGGASPYLPERRANAFAAEFLLPRWQARVSYKEKRSVDKTLAALTVRFKVGQVLAAAQLLNAANTGVSQSEQSKLDKIVKEDRD
jgi:Zn-dependent peptidase ImmA (M78 family)